MGQFWQSTPIDQLSAHGRFNQLNAGKRRRRLTSEKRAELDFLRAIAVAPQEQSQ